MITEKQIQKAVRQASAGGGKDSIVLRDDGERGSGRLVIVLTPRLGGRVSAEWYAFFHRQGKRVKAKLGSYPALPLAEGRRKFLNEYAPAISSGQDPTAARRREASAGTVGELFEAYLDHLQKNGKRGVGNVRGLLLSPTSGAAKAIGADRQAAEITPVDIVPHLASIYSRGARAQANVARSYISAAFSFGLRAEHDFTKADIGARWGLKSNPVSAIPSDAGARRAGDRFLSPAEFRTFWWWLDDYRGRSALAPALMLKMATGQRSEEILQISDEGYDRGKAMLNWDKTKNGLAHSIPLPHQAIAILDRLGPNSHGFFFPHQSDPSRCALYGSLRDIIGKFIEENPGFARFTPRDLRRTWKTLAGHAGISKEMRDRLQNHAKGGDVSSRHYDRYGYLPERTGAMAKWAAYLDLMIAGHIDQLGAREGNVVPFGATTGAQL